MHFIYNISFGEEKSTFFSCLYKNMLQGNKQSALACLLYSYVAKQNGIQFLHYEDNMAVLEMSHLVLCLVNNTGNIAMHEHMMSSSEITHGTLSICNNST